VTEEASVFHQLGYENADELAIKAELVASIHALVKVRAFTQEQAAKVLGMPRPEVSHLMRGRLGRFTIDRLVRAHNALAPDIRIGISSAVGA
jgi:predicted XRE-type DNA-binding protein